MAKILLCEQDSNWSQKFEDAVTEDIELLGIAHSGLEAQVILGKTRVDVLIINLETKKHTVFEVIKFVKQNSAKTNIILIANNKDILNDYFYDEADVKKTGVSCVFVKPFPVYHIFKYITDTYYHQSWKDVEETKNDDEDLEVSEPDSTFTSMMMEEFGISNIAIFDLYIRLGRNKYIKLYRKGNQIDGKKLKDLNQNKEVKRLYFKTKDRLSYLNFLNSMIKSSSKVDIAKVQGASELLIEEIYLKGIQDNVVDEAMSICESIYSSIKSNNELNKLILKLTGENSMENEKTHVFLTAFICAIITKNIDWITSYTRNKLIFGSFLYDIGKIKLSQLIRNTKIEDMNEIQLKEFKKHPEYGVELVEEIDGVNEQIKQIIYQHHELNNGMGYPLGLHSNRIYALAKIVGFADCVAAKCLEYQLAPLETAKRMIEERDEIMNYEPDVVKAFIKGFIKI